MPTHPYLAGNFAPIASELPLTPCSISGSIPPSLRGGQYVRNGSNPAHIANSKDEAWKGREYHWFDGDGMLSGVLFGERGECWFVNKYLVTDVLLASQHLTRPLLPSISTLVSPSTSLPALTLSILRSLLLVLFAHPVRALSVANTSLIFHSRRALALCESGPPLEVRLPELDTVGWFTWKQQRLPNTSDQEEVGGLSDSGSLLPGFFASWTTAHPRIDPRTHELLLFSSSFLPPYLRYSIISPLGSPTLLSAPIPLAGAKMMHDFGVSQTHTVILDLPLTLDPVNVFRGRPALYFDPEMRSRFGVLPRYMDAPTRWFEDEPCVVFHCANAWDTPSPSSPSTTEAVNLLCCRFRTAALVFAAGDLPLPPSSSSAAEDPPLLHYFRFPLSPSPSGAPLRPSHSFPLLAIPFEFPALPPPLHTLPSRYIYGCSMHTGSFTAALGGAAKISCIVRVDVLTLIARSHSLPPRSSQPIDPRSMPELLSSTSPSDPVRVFALPRGIYAQEPTFVPSASFSASSQLDGHLLFYTFDEAQLLQDGSAPRGARSELWVLDARDMKTVVSRVELPQRVPYGLHGSFVTATQIASQIPGRPVRSRLSQEEEEVVQKLMRGVRERVGRARKGDPFEVLLHCVAAVQICLAGAVLLWSMVGGGGGAGGGSGLRAEL